MVECIAWAPETATPAIREATATAGGDSSAMNSNSTNSSGNRSSTAALSGPFLASGSRDKTIKVSIKINLSNKNESIDYLPYPTLLCHLMPISFFYFKDLGRIYRNMPFHISRP